MALKKTIETSAGVTADYWRLNSININTDSPRIEQEFAVWVDETKRSEGKDRAPIPTMKITATNGNAAQMFLTEITEDDFGKTLYDLVARVCYAYSKDTHVDEDGNASWFADAEDLL